MFCELQVASVVLARHGHGHVNENENENEMVMIDGAPGQVAAGERHT
jgi:hypothetical protein